MKITTDLPYGMNIPIVTAQQMRFLDASAVSDYNIPSVLLMENAANESRF